MFFCKEQAFDGIKQVALTGKRKAAALLMNLDERAASELLKGLSPDDVQEIAVEMARIDASDTRDKKEEAKIVREFCQSLQKSQSRGLGIKAFLGDVLMGVVGREKAEQIQDQVRKATEKEDPFETIRSAERDELVLALESEHPQTIAVIMSELDIKKSQEILPLLDKEACLEAIWRMAKPPPLATKVKQRMASIVTQRLQSVEGETIVEKPKETLRKLAITLNDLENSLRDELLGEINKHDEETAATVKNLMVTWEDILTIADRSLQEAMRGVNSKTFAVALYGADEEIVQKVRSNISERASAAVDEEMSLMQEPLPEEILDAREEIVKPLREANEEGTLRRVKR